MIRLVIATIEYILIIFGILTFIFGVMEVKRIATGLPNITQETELKPYLNKTVELDTFIEDSGYVLTKAYSDTAVERYFYIGQVKDQIIFLTSTSEMDFTEDSTKIVGTLTNNTSEEYIKLVDEVCKDENMDAAAFEKTFTPYIFEIISSGESAQSDYMSKTATTIVISIGMIIGGFAVLISKRRSKRIVQQKANANL